jgi:hypothetical protein
MECELVSVSWFKGIFELKSNPIFEPRIVGLSLSILDQVGFGLAGQDWIHFLPVLGLAEDQSGGDFGWSWQLAVPLSSSITYRRLSTIHPPLTRTLNTHSLPDPFPWKDRDEIFQCKNFPSNGMRPSRLFIKDFMAFMVAQVSSQQKCGFVGCVWVSPWFKLWLPTINGHIWSPIHTPQV